MSKRLLESSESSEGDKLWRNNEDDSNNNKKRSFIGSWKDTNSTSNEDNLIELSLEDIASYDEIVKRVENRQASFPFPRIVKRDLRKKLPIMITNVINGHDFDLLASFFKTFCRGDGCQMQLACLNSKLPAFEMPTIDHIVYYMGAFLETFPDCVYQMSNFQLKQRVYPVGTEITCFIKCLATSIYPVAPPDLGRIVLETLADPTKAKRCDTDPLANYDIYNPSSLHSCGLPRLEMPSAKVVYLTLTMNVDEQKRIQRIEQSAVISSVA